MKKILCLLIFMLLLSPAYAKSHHSHNNPPHSSCSGSCSTPVYMVGKETKIEEVRYPDCKEHYVVQETTTSLYSDGSKRTFANNNIYNADGSVLISNCSDVKHVMYGDKHYFIVKKEKNYEIIDDKAQPVTIRQYSKIQEADTNRLLVKYNKKYGIIDLNEQTIVPIKYQKFDEISHNIFLTKLGKYYGIVDIDNRIILNNDCDRIKPLFDTFVVKKANKYGLLDLNTNTILKTEYDKIGKLGEYITVKKNGKYQVYDYSGKLLAPNQYKRLRLNRNHLQGYINRWVDVPVEVNLYK